MRGYDPIIAMHFKNDDPGYRGQIFEPMYQGPDGKSRKEFFWQEFPAECDLIMSTKLVRNFQQYVDGIDRYKFYVSNGSDDVANQLKLLSKIGNFNVNNVGSNHQTQVYKFFQETQGEIFVSKMECNMKEIIIETEEDKVKPVFTKSFQRAVMALYKAAKNNALSQKDRERKFRSFVKEFGTHFLKKSLLGIRIEIENMFAKRTDSQLEASENLDCVMNAIGNQYGNYSLVTAEFESDNVKFDAKTNISFFRNLNHALLSNLQLNCDRFEGSNSYFLRNGVSIGKVINIGKLKQRAGRGIDDIEHPGPTRFELESIGEIFNPSKTSDLRISEETTLDSTAMQFLYNFWTSMMKRERFCEVVFKRNDCFNPMPQGCGISDTCGSNVICAPDVSNSGAYTCKSIYIYL